MREADTQSLFAVQVRSYQAAGPGIRESYPEHLAMNVGQLSAFLDGKRYAVFATSRPDGRPHAAPVAFCVWSGAFWVASVRGVRIRNLQVKPYASIVIMEGEGTSHRAVLAEGPVTLHMTGVLKTMPGEFQALVGSKIGEIEAWATTLIELRPERLFSYDWTRSKV